MGGGASSLESLGGRELDDLPHGHRLGSLPVYEDVRIHRQDRLRDTKCDLVRKSFGRKAKRLSSGERPELGEGWVCV